MSNNSSPTGITPVEAQIIKTFKHIRTGSYKTRAGYKGKCLNFIKFCYDKFRIENIRNIHDDHVVAYILDRQNKEIAVSTIADDLSAIRFLMDHVSNPRYELSSNAQLEEQYDILIGKVSLNPGNRAWDPSEYELFVQVCNQLQAKDPIDVSILCKTMGLRITEAVAATRAQAEYALRVGEYQVKHEAKNGRWRKVPLSPEARDMFTRRLPNVDRGGHIFIKPGQKTHIAVDEFEQFLRKIRDRIKCEAGISKRTFVRSGKTHTNDITWHGLRYVYAQARMQHLLESGFTNQSAQQIVSQELGHNRLSVVETYIGKFGYFLNSKLL